MIKSPLRYPGGKSRAVKTIKKLIPHFDEFREPFVGGGSVFIYSKQMNHQKKFWINDLHPNLFEFWKIAQEDVDSLIKQVKKWRVKFKEGKILHRYLIVNISQFNPTKKAAAFFILNRISFSGTTESGGFSNQAFEKRFTESSIKRLEKIAPVLKDIKITNYDYQRVIEEKGKNVFIFLDPPYFSATNSALYGKNGSLHKTFNHERFAEIMGKCPHKWLITYDDSPYIRSLFSFANIQSWNLTYGMRNVTADGDQQGKELFVSNY